MKKISLVLVLLLTTCWGLSHMVISKAQQTPRDIKDIPLDKSGLSQKQKYHRKYLEQSGERKLPALASKGTGDILVTVEQGFTISTAKTDVEPTLLFTACNVGTIVVGTLTDESPQLTEDESFLFTEYTMHIDEVIKDKRATGLQAGGDITVIRGGGVGRINGRTIRAEREGFKPFAVGTRYVLFLKDIPETGAYLAYPYGSFALQSDVVVPFGKLPKDVPTAPAPFLNVVRNLNATSACVN